MFTRVKHCGMDDGERAERPNRAFLTLRRALALAAIVVATLAGSHLALVSFRQDRELSVGEELLRSLQRQIDRKS